MAIAYDNASSARNSGSSSLTFSHTVSGSNRILVVQAAGGGQTVTGVTYNGVAMTQATFNGVSPIYFLYTFYLIAPATGSNNVVITGSAVLWSLALSGGAISITGGHQTAPLGATNTGQGLSSAPSISITTTTNNSWIFDTAAVTASGLTLNVANGQTKRYNTTFTQAGSTLLKATAGAQTVGYTNVMAGWLMNAIEILEEPSSSTVVKDPILASGVIPFAR